MYKKGMLFITALTLMLSLDTVAEDPYLKKRIKMVQSQIAARGITDKKVLKIMKETPRHQFVPPKEMKHAYADRPLPIGYGQTISQPYMVAYMTELLKLSKTDRVLEVGTGSGYQAAVLSPLVKKVYTIEVYKTLHARTKARLKALKYKNIETKHADGYYGWKEKGPFDAIIVTCAPSFVPPPLIQQLKKGGRMVIPIGPPFTIQKLMLLTKKSKDEVITQEITDVMFVPFIRSAN